MLLALSLLASAATAYADEAWGVWSDKDGEYTYYFLENSEFRFSGVHGPVEGVWKTRPDVCSLRGGNKGNLMIYADTGQCCMDAQLLGGKLVLSDIWRKNPGGGPHMWEVCANRVLKSVDPRGPKGK